MSNDYNLNEIDELSIRNTGGFSWDDDDYDCGDEYDKETLKYFGDIEEEITEEERQKYIEEIKKIREKVRKEIEEKERKEREKWRKKLWVTSF